MKWMPVFGRFSPEGDGLVFEGESTTYKDDQGQERVGKAFGVAICDRMFTGGTIRARVSFNEVSNNCACELVFYWDAQRQARLSAGIGPPTMFCVRSWDGEYRVLANTGDRRNLLAKRAYDLRIAVTGSRLQLFVDDVEVLASVLPTSVPMTQVGVFCFDDSRVTVSDFTVDEHRGRVFAVMELSDPYRDVYEGVVKKICNEQYEIRNAEETYGPGFIMADVARDIVESEFVVADITPQNPNVYYEVGYADAIGKPVIMIADRAKVKDLPFDVSHSRVLFYQNTIAGKAKFEEAFRKTLQGLERKRLQLGGRGLTSQ